MVCGGAQFSQRFLRRFLLAYDATKFTVIRDTIYSIPTAIDSQVIHRAVDASPLPRDGAVSNVGANQIFLLTALCIDDSKLCSKHMNNSLD